ncbi:ATP-binding cassette domain-containing protein [Pseudoduganella lutea]|uniref:ATP-binding cassette domain-containing protein n=2 Tax=Pseudoduganella lutea TaxID=321985 RepID=A0A4P6L6U1_9BURK|nr:branched-chain amino acid ABC transporter ATP-binding protein/permease [Pseudoduganella lutea]QBE67441.1 ATP-binding cassette domain-containing protein [Pseudoduganella lutea]
MLVVGIVLALTLNAYHAFVLASVALLAIVGCGLNVLIGLGGMMSFGHVGFYALGAYTVAMLTTGAGWNFWLAWPAGVAVAALAGGLLAVPALRVRGPYLAMVTIAFAFIVEHGIVEMRELTGGQNGIMGIAAPAFGGLEGERAVAILALLAAVAATWVCALLARGTWGAAIRAVRDSETAAESLGIDPLRVKAAAFVFSAALAGLAGGLFAPLSGFVTPHSFNFPLSILFVLVVMIGGAGSIAGPLIGAVIVGLLPEWLASLEEFRLLFFGALLLVVLLVAPGGAVGLLQGLSRRMRLADAHPAASAQPVPTVPDMPDMPAGEAIAVRERQPLRASGLAMVFGGLRAASGISLTVQPGVLTSLIGPNGAGKSTVINMLTGFYRPTEGEIAVGSAACGGQPAFRFARAGVARTYQTSLLFGSLTVLDNVTLAMTGGRLGGFLGSARYAAPAARERAARLLAFCGYRGDLATPAAGLAHVDRRLVEIARALATDPDILLLDEPAAGLSREDKGRLAELLTRVARAGIGVLVVEHDMPLVMGISDRIVVIDAGKPLAEGTPAEIRDDPAVRRAYLGEGEGVPALATAGGARHAGAELLGIGALSAGYGAAPVLQRVDIQVRQGELVALLGANGAGKSTLMRALAGLHRPVQGGMHLDGVALEDLNAEQVVRQGLILVPEGRQVFPELSVLDNIRLGAFRCPAGTEARLEAMLDRFPRLRERAHQRAGLLSGGEQQMLAIARGLMAQPRVLLLDEPSLGLAPKVIEDLFAVLDRLRGEALTILLVDQMASLALALADRAYVLEGGKVVAQGTAADIAGDSALAKAYLGGH